MAEKVKSLLQIKLEYWGFLGLYNLVRALPMRHARKLGRFLTGILFFLDVKHARRSVSHILHAGMAAGRRDAKKLARRSFGEFGELLAEIVQMDKLYDLKNILITATEKDMDYMLPERNPAGPRQVIVVTAHLGNWEVAGTAFSQRIATPMVSLMRPFSNPQVGEKILAHRRGPTHTVVDKHQGIRPLLRGLKEGNIATILIDQHAAGKEGVECIFFGHPARVHMTPALLHLKTGVPIAPEVTVRVPGTDFSFNLHFAELIRYTPTGDKEYDVQVLTQRCISALEKLIRRYPEAWLWAPRHWLDLDRRQAAEYQHWTPPEAVRQEYERMMSAPSAPVVTLRHDGTPVEKPLA